MPSTDEPSLNALLTIFDIVEKADLDQHCKAAVIQGSDLADLIIACQMEAIPIGHIPIFKHHHPEHLSPTDADLRAFGANGVGPFSKDARKFVNKIGQIFEQRRLFCGHLFLPLVHPSEWHLLYFDQRDTDSDRNHWEHGSHLHLMNMVTHPQLPVLDLMEKIDGEVRPKLGGGFHIRFER